MKILVDINLSPRWCANLRTSGISAQHWSDVGAATASDAEIMTYARAKGFIVMTSDLDFSAILAATNAKGPSVVQLRARDVMPAAIGNVVLVALRTCAADLQRGALLTINTDRSRLRILPLMDDVE